jgi:hypothetical protein
VMLRWLLQALQPLCNTFAASNTIRSSFWFRRLVSVRASCERGESQRRNLSPSLVTVMKRPAADKSGADTMAMRPLSGPTAHVLELRRQGLTDSHIREDLKSRKYKAARISQLMSARAASSASKSSAVPTTAAAENIDLSQAAGASVVLQNLLQTDDNSDKKKQTKESRMKEAGRKPKMNSDLDSSGDEKVKNEKKKKKKKSKDKKKAKQLSSSSNESDKKEKQAKKDPKEKKRSRASPSPECSKKDDEALAMPFAKSLLTMEKKAEKGRQEKKSRRASPSPECSKKEGEAKAMAMAIAMSCWSLGRVQKLLAEAENIKHGLGNLAGGVFPVDKLQVLLDKIPRDILLLSPNLVLPMPAEDAPQEIKNDIAKIFVNHVLRAAEEAELYFSVQAGLPSGSSK